VRKVTATKHFYGKITVMRKR